MRRRSASHPTHPWLGVTALAVALAGCRQTVEFVAVNADGGSGDDAGGVPSGLCLEGQTPLFIQLSPESSVIVVALDRSTSMNDPFGYPGYPSKLDAAKQSLLAVVQRYQATVRFSYVGFPGMVQSGCFPDSECCSRIDPSVPASGTGGSSLFEQAILACDTAPATCAVGSQRPTAAALAGCVGLYESIDLRAFRNRYVLLVTDGDPGCPGSSSDACKDAQVQVSTLGNPNLNVSTSVVGLGTPSSGSGCLAKLALTGNGNYYPTRASDLDGTLETITHAMAADACHVNLQTTPSNFANVIVSQNGTQVPRSNVDGDGWQSDGSSSRITLYGKACDTLLEQGMASTTLVDCGDPPRH